MTVEHDPFIARALAGIDVPEHAPGFWEELERRLEVTDIAAEGSVASPTTEADPEVGADTTEPPAAASTADLPTIADLYLPEWMQAARKPRIWFSAVAAAAIIVLLVTTVFFSDDDDNPEVAVEATTSSEPDDDPVTTVATTAATTTSTEAPELASPDTVVTDWLDAVAAGDIDTAAALTGPRSTAHVGSLGEGASIEGLIEESAEGYGGLSAAADLEVHQYPLGSFEFGEVTLVAVSGTHSGEGTDGARQTVVIPVVTDDGGSVVEPWAFGPDGDRFDVTQPEDGVLDAARAIELFAPVHGTVYFRLDDGIEGIRPVETSTVAGAPFARYDPPGELEPGEHVVILGFVDPDGEIVLGEAVTFTVE